MLRVCEPSCGGGLGRTVSFGGGGAFGSRSFGTFTGSRFISPFGVWPWQGWQNPWPQTTWYLYYPEYYPQAQACPIGNIRLTEDQTRRLAAGQTVTISVTDTCGKLVTVTLGGPS